MMLRNMLWWDGKYHEGGPVGDAYLPLGGVARLTAHTPQGSPVVLAIKAGHNDENHNQNDVGSFILHVDGESLLDRSRPRPLYPAILWPGAVRKHFRQLLRPQRPTHRRADAERRSRVLRTDS